ncbi:MAG TPA: carboxypeptidase-like regulatory domain-containing protein [Anaerolineales bacterium]
MIEQVDEQLTAWVESVVSGIKPSLAAPTDAEDSLAVSVYLLEMVDDPQRRLSERPLLQPVLRYLVTTSAGDPKDAHHLLSVLFYAALDNPNFDVELEPVSSQIWTAFRILPRPAFILRVPLDHEWPASQPPRVRQVAAKSTIPANFFGLVLGPGDIPLALVQVDYPALNRSTYTDPQGRFVLGGVPPAPQEKKLILRAKGLEQAETLQETGSPDSPVVIHFSIP